MNEFGSAVGYISRAVRRLRTVTRLDAALRWVSRPRIKRLDILPSDAIPVLLYSPANLNRVDGSTIWVSSVAETLLVDTDVHLTLPLRSPIHREIITGPLRALPRVELIDAHPRIAARTLGLTTSQALNLIERLDAIRPYSHFVLRSFALCLAAVDRPRLQGRIWSCYILEPERDTEDPVYRADMARIAAGSRFVAVQSVGMEELLHSLVPETRGRTILLPPGIPVTAPAAPATRTTRRLIYTGKFHPFYPVERMIDDFEVLRGEFPDLEFHLAGDKIMRPEEDPDYPARLEGRLRGTPGVVWHGSLPRDATTRLVGEGGIALNLWDYRYGPRMNDLVISTKLLDYAAAGVPIVLTRTRSQEELLGADYPLFTDAIDEALPLLRRVLTDAALHNAAGARAFEASRAYTYPALHGLIAPHLRLSQRPR